MIPYTARLGHKPLTAFYTPSFDHKFNPSAAEAVRDYSIAMVEGAADPAWLEEAYIAALEIARKMEHFTTDDIWALLYHRNIPEPREPRAIAAVMKKLSETEHAEATNQTRQSIRVVCHRRPLRIWKSNIWETENG